MKTKEPAGSGDEEDLQNVMQEEGHRGRRRGVIDTAARERQARQRRAFLDLLDAGATDEEIAEAVTALRGHEPDAEELKQILRRCREYRRGR